MSATNSQQLKKKVDKKYTCISMHTFMCVCVCVCVCTEELESKNGKILTFGKSQWKVYGA